MKYTIYKLNSKFASYRWWRNYDSNNRNAPDINIESYISAKGLSWTPLLNTKGEAQKYQTISTDSFDDIELYFNDINNVPDYIKIEFEKANGIKESAYYYVNFPSIYNATNKLASEVKYRLDKIASTFYLFHSHLKTTNPNMFYVRKHMNRLKQGTNIYYFDFNEQPWYLRTSDNVNETLIPIQKSTYDTNYLRSKQIDYINQFKTEGLNKIDYYFTDDKLYWRLTPDSEYTNNITAEKLYTQQPSGSSLDIHILIPFIDDSRFKIKGDSPLVSQYDQVYEYIIVKPASLYRWTQAVESIDFAKEHLTELLVIPVAHNETSADNFGKNNTMNTFRNFDSLFNTDNIVARITHNISPITLWAKLPENSTNWESNTYRIYNDNKGETTTFIDAFLVSAKPCGLELTDNVIIDKIKTLMNNFNGETKDYRKIKANNPHLLAPQYKQVSYYATSNNIATLTCDYINVKEYQDLKLLYNYFITSEWTSRLLVNKWNELKPLSQTANELTCTDTRQAPIQCTAWNNAYLQRNLLDNSKNNLVKKDVTTMVSSYILTALGGILSATGYGAPIGLGMVAGGIAGIVGTGVNLGNGLAQIETQKKNLYQAPNTMNTSIYSAGLGFYNTWAINGLLIYSMSISEQDENIVNNDDNMYGYYPQTWLPYTDYLTCWDGNYMLCDISKNYNSLFTSLKSIDSIFTLSDKYINEFLNALNNGITWFDNGNYVDLATDENNWERVFPRQ